MFRVVKCALVGATLSLFAVAPASAEAIDVSTITCGEMIESVTGAFPKNTDKAAPANPSQERAAQKMGVIMIWLHGYNASEDRGTVLDYAQVKSYAEELGAFCALNPKIGLMTAAKKYSGDNAPKPSRDAVDVSTIKCSALKDGANEKLSVAIIWLGGWQAGVDDESTFDFEEFGRISPSLRSFAPRIRAKASLPPPRTYSAIELHSGRCVIGSRPAGSGFGCSLGGDPVGRHHPHGAGLAVVAVA